MQSSIAKPLRLRFFLWLEGKQDRPRARLDGFAVLVDDFNVEGDPAAAHACGFFFLADGEFNVERVADENGQAEFHLQPAKSDDGAFHEAKLVRLPNGVAEREHAMGDALPEGRAFHVFGVGMHGVVVARQPGELDNVGFGDGAPACG